MNTRNFVLFACIFIVSSALTASFGYYLQEREDFAEYFSEDYVAQYDDLAWGVYEGE